MLYVNSIKLLVILLAILLLFGGCILVPKKICSKFKIKKRNQKKSQSDDFENLNDAVNQTINAKFTIIYFALLSIILFGIVFLSISYLSVNYEISMNTAISDFKKHSNDLELFCESNDMVCNEIGIEESKNRYTKSYLIIDNETDFKFNLSFNYDSKIKMKEFIINIQNIQSYNDEKIIKAIPQTKIVALFNYYNCYGTLEDTVFCEFVNEIKNGDMINVIKNKQSVVYEYLDTNENITLYYVDNSKTNDEVVLKGFIKKQ